MAELKVPEKRYWVKKSNELIMARHKLSLAEQRLIVSVASMLQPNDEDFTEYIVPVADYLKLIDSKAKNEYQRMKDLCESILKKPLFIKTERGFKGLNWFSTLEYDEIDTVLKCKFHPDLKPFMLDLGKKFTTYQLANALRLKSKYSFALYEHCARILQHRDSAIWEIELTELRSLLSIPKNYRWQDVKRWIIEPAKFEFEVTDLRFTYTVKKLGRRIHSLKINITNTHQLALELPPKSDSDTANEKNPAENLLDLVPLNQKKDVKKLLATAQKKFPPEYIREKITLANSQKNLENYPGWLSKALADDYKKSEKSQKKKSEKPKKSQTKKTEDDKKTAEAVAEQRAIRKKFAALSEQEKEKWIARARSEAAECGGADLLPRGLILIHAADLWAEAQQK